MKITFGPNDYIEMEGSGENGKLTEQEFELFGFAIECRTREKEEIPEIWQRHFQKNKKGVKDKEESKTSTTSKKTHTPFRSVSEFL